MNRSFVCGIIVASTTWCFSLYLYWSLTRNSIDVPLESFHLAPMPDSQHYVALKHSNYHNGLNQLNDNEANKYQEQKDNLYKKYKKDKKFRKISQKLMDELKPIREQGGKGRFFAYVSKSVCFQTNKILNFQMNSEWFRMLKSN